MSKVGRYVLCRMDQLKLMPLRNDSPSEEEVTITRMLDKIIRRSDVIDKESLCIQSGQRVGQMLIHTVLLVELNDDRYGICDSLFTSWRILETCWIVHA